MKRKNGINEIARIAKVSPTTVVNVINGKRDKMSAETFQRVNDIINETGFVKKKAPNLLSGKGIKLRGILVVDVDIDNKKECFDQIVKFVQQNSVSDYSTIILVENRKKEIIEFVKGWDFDSVFYIGRSFSDIEEIKNKSGIPIIALM